MSDHVDGPRQIGDPAADLTDLFAFTSPADGSRTVLAADVFPSAGADAIFSNAVDHALVLRRLQVTGPRNAPRFSPGSEALRFSCRFGVLQARGPGNAAVQRGTCTLPDGQSVPLVVNDTAGAASADGTYRVFAGLRSDPFYLAWLVKSMKKFPNLLQYDNVLSIVIEFDTRRVLDPSKGTLWGVIAETVPIPQPASFVGHEPARLDWVGRPEMTNIRLNNPQVEGDDVRDIWNQQTPFALDAQYRPVFRQRMVDSLLNWDQRDGKADWTPEALAACADMMLDDFLVFDTTMPITDTSHLEIEKSTLAGRPHRTGGGRTVDANVIDILFTWMINNDREFLQGGAMGATQAGLRTFPYLAPPNAQLQTVVESVELKASAAKVWEHIGSFGALWHPLVARMRLTGMGVGQLRTIETIDGKQIVERLEALDNTLRSYRYGGVSGIPASDYTGTLDVKSNGAGSTVLWRARYLADGQPDIIVKTIVTTLFKTGLDGLKKHFEPAQ